MSDHTEFPKKPAETPDPPPKTPAHPLPPGHVFGYPGSLRVHDGASTPLDRISILEIQSGLRQAGFQVTVNGIYTEQTEIAVLDFQYRERLEITGRVGTLTWARLKSYTRS